MSRTLGQLERGTVVKLEEKGVLAEYFVLDKDDVSTVLFRKDPYVSRRMNPTNESTYENSEADQWLNNDETGFLSIFTEAMRNCLISRNIDVHAYGDTETHIIPRRCYLLSEKELFNSGTPADGKYMLQYLFLCMNTTDANSARIARDGTGSGVHWWLRSPVNATQFRYVNSNGAISNVNATGAFWLRPALSVANATIVSDEGTDEIILHPDGDALYRKIDAVVNVGSTQHRPIAARVLVDASGLKNVRVEVANNCKDDAPAWVECTGGSTVSLENTEKTSEQWEIGVHLYGEAEGSLGRFYEPLVITEEV